MVADMSHVCIGAEKMITVVQIYPGVHGDRNPRWSKMYVKDSMGTLICQAVIRSRTWKVKNMYGVVQELMRRLTKGKWSYGGKKYSERVNGFRQRMRSGIVYGSTQLCTDLIINYKGTASSESW